MNHFFFPFSFVSLTVAWNLTTERTSDTGKAAILGRGQLISTDVSMPNMIWSLKSTSISALYYIIMTIEKSETFSFVSHAVLIEINSRNISACSPPGPVSVKLFVLSFLFFFFPSYHAARRLICRSDPGPAKNREIFSKVELCHTNMSL